MRWFEGITEAIAPSELADINWHGEQLIPRDSETQLLMRHHYWRTDTDV